jgi:hypothetical protein
VMSRAVSFYEAMIEQDSSACGWACADLSILAGPSKVLVWTYHMLHSHTALPGLPLQCIPFWGVLAEKLQLTPCLEVLLLSLASSQSHQDCATCHPVIAVVPEHVTLCIPISARGPRDLRAGGSHSAPAACCWLPQPPTHADLASSVRQQSWTSLSLAVIKNKPMIQWRHREIPFHIS